MLTLWSRLLGADDANKLPAEKAVLIVVFFGLVAAFSLFGLFAS